MCQVVRSTLLIHSIQMTLVINQTTVRNDTYLRQRTLLPEDVADEYILQVVPCDQVIPEPFCWPCGIMWRTILQKQ